ncbi:MAG: hypothetical protein GY851_12255 [bacterium]|nr:hypothetical protein [bacterium]
MRELRWSIMGALLLSLGMMASTAAGQESRPVDLGPQAQAVLTACFPNLAPGAKTVDGIEFQVPGTRLSVQPQQKVRLGLDGAKCGSLHFLHYTEHSGEKIGAYVIEYTDGERVEIELFGGLNIQDWWMPGPVAFAAQAHTDAFLRGDGQQPIGFWRMSVPNPRPDVPLAAVEVQNTQHQAVINVVAITLAGPCGDKVGETPVWRPDMDERDRLSAMLAVSEGTANKAWIFEQLRAVATREQIPMLAESLTDEKLSHAARLVLEAMPHPEAVTALRDALGATSGAAKMGIAESLGRRRDAESAPLVAALLRDENPVMASAAALALGRIGGPVAIKQLKATLVGGVEGVFEAAVLEGLLHCAESLCAEDEKAAHALYGEILPAAAQDHQVTAALRGTILTGGDEAAGIAVSALLKDTPAGWAAALPAVREIDGAEATQAFSSIIARVPEGVLVGLIEALGQRGDSAAAPAVAAMLKNDDPEARSTAIATLSLIGDGSSVPALAEMAAHGSKTERAQAAEALAQLNTPDVPTALQALAQGDEAAVVVAVAIAMGDRREPVAVPVLRELARHGDGGVRGAAALALAEVGDASDTELLCTCAADAEEAKERGEAERALIALGRKLDAPEPFVETVLSRLEKGNPELRCALLRVCGEFRNPRMVQALGRALDDDATVRDAAVRALADSKDPGAVEHLLTVAETAQDLTQSVLALRGIARLASGDALEETVRGKALQRAITVATRADEKKLLLGALGGCHTTDALKCAEAHLEESDIVAEAAMAWSRIAAHVDMERADALAMLEKVKQASVSPEVEQAVAEIVRKATATPVPGEQVRFERVVVDKQFRSEGVAVADVNRDGHKDILVGDVCYMAPDWQVREIRPPQTYDAQKGYSQCFANFTKDVDQDGWMDSIVVGFPAAPAHWYRNPGEAAGHWEQHPLAPSACGETPIFGDLLSDGQPLPVFAMAKRITWFKPRDNKKAEWHAFPVTQELPEFERFGHGLGMGDVNGDGRIDLIGTGGWWEAPEDRSRRDWTFHKASLGPACADLVVYDVDGDGDSDIVSSSAHEYGIWWFEQRSENGVVSFEQHEIDKSISQTHALILADMNNDGVMDLVTGKRYRAHNGNDPGSDEPAILCWIELQRPQAGEVRFVMREIDNDSGVGTQFEVCDLDGDGLLDVVASNKKGVHAFVQRRSN